MRIRIVDAFTDRPFGGNPAGVVLLDGDSWPEKAWMRHVAAEMHLPMTAFAHRLPVGSEADWALRWFNPVIEEKLCGHATLATAYAVHQDRGTAGTVRFSTASGVLVAHTREDGTIILEFPAVAVSERSAPEGLAKALGVELGATYDTGALHDVLAVLADEATVRSLAPDLAMLAQLCIRDDIRGVTVTAAAADPNSGHDFVSRFFSPHHGLPEDSVTGSAHSALAPYWSARLGQDSLIGLQASARTGLIGTEIHGDRVHLTGRAVTVLDGTLLALGA